MNELLGDSVDCACFFSHLVNIMMSWQNLNDALLQDSISDKLEKQVNNHRLQIQMN